MLFVCVYVCVYSPCVKAEARRELEALREEKSALTADILRELGLR